MKIGILLFILLVSVSISAQAPQAFNYQGIARDVSGTPLANKNISLHLTIRQGGITGIVEYEEEHSVQTNKLGLFNVEVGRGLSPVGSFDDIAWEAGEHYIDIEIDPEGGQNYIPMGVAQLLSVPYALYAGSSDNPWNDNAFGIHYNSGNVGIGTSAPQSALSIEGIDADGVGRQYMSIWNRSLSDRSAVYISLSAGDNVNNTYLTHLSETYDFNNNDFNDFGQLDSRGAGLMLTAPNSIGVIRFLTNHAPVTNVPLERMRINSEGNVGIGTRTPNSKLQIADGDVFIENISSGVIMKSPDGNCWRVTVQNGGTLKTDAIVCPN